MGWHHHPLQPEPGPRSLAPADIDSPWGSRRHRASRLVVWAVRPAEQARVVEVLAASGGQGPLSQLVVEV